MNNRFSYLLCVMGVLLVSASFVMLSSANLLTQKTIRTSAMKFNLPAYSSVVALDEKEAFVSTQSGVTASITHVTNQCATGFAQCTFRHSKRLDRNKNLAFPTYLVRSKQFAYTVENENYVQAATMKFFLESHNQASASTLISRYYVTDPAKGMFVIEVTGTRKNAEAILDLANVLHTSFQTRSSDVSFR